MNGFELTEQKINQLVELALRARERAYVPYSHFRVGACLMSKNGTLYCGCNIENAAYTPTNCAERTAVFKAVSEGKKDFLAIAVVGDREEPLTPCGVCRQVLTEFVDGSTFEVIMEDGAGGIKVMKLEELFPASFSPKDLQS